MPSATAVRCSISVKRSDLLDELNLTQGVVERKSTRGRRCHEAHRRLIVGGMITSTIHVLILVPIFFALMKERALRTGTLSTKTGAE
jgi:hypothetical protein